MGALANATALRKDQTFYDWLTTAAIYTAREIIQEDPATPDHNVRLMLANDVASSPELISSQLLVLVATDPDVAKLGATADLVGENTVITKVQNIWTTISKMRYPQA